MNIIIDKKKKKEASIFCYLIPHQYSQAELEQRIILYIFNGYLENNNVFHYKR